MLTTEFRKSQKKVFETKSVGNIKLVVFSEMTAKKIKKTKHSKSPGAINVFFYNNNRQT